MEVFGGLNLVSLSVFFD